jgi:Histidine kinase-like ATPase domain
VPSPLVCQVRRRLPVAVVSLFGTLDEMSVVTAVVVLRDCLADQPSALVIDGSHLAVTGRAALRPLEALAGEARRWPGAPVSLCALPAAAVAMLGRGIPDTALGTCDDADATAERELRRPVPPRVDARLSPGPEMPARCRELVGQACQEWGVPRVGRLAQLIVSELASNAVLHARTPATLTVRLLGHCLHLAIRDGDPRLVVAPAPGLHGAHQREHGRGLLILEAMADEWGSLATGDGKVVWAQVSIPDRAAGPA